MMALASQQSRIAIGTILQQHPFKVLYLKSKGQERSCEAFRFAGGFSRRDGYAKPQANPLF
jgi:hypothetical protein